MRIVEGDSDAGTGDLLLDVDYILEWIKIGERFEFRIAPALLQFHEVFGLRIELDYTTLCAGIGPFSLDGINRESLANPSDPAAYHWRLDINWPHGHIKFDAPGFTQTQTGPEAQTARQHLLQSERPAQFLINE